MLEIMRSHKFFSVFLLTVITVMITVAFIFWGIGPKDNPEITVVAQIEDKKITLTEFYRAYDNEYQNMKEKYADPAEIEKINLKDIVFTSLIDRAVLLSAAKEAGITVTDNELQEAILGMPFFQRNGTFDNSVYQRALKLRRLTPQAFEDSLRNDMLITKISRMIGDTAELSGEESKILEAIKEGDKGQLSQMFLATKRNQAVKAYIEGFKRKLKIKINKDIIP